MVGFLSSLSIKSHAADKTEVQVYSKVLSLTCLKVQDFTPLAAKSNVIVQSIESVKESPLGKGSVITVGIKESGLSQVWVIFKDKITQEEYACLMFSKTPNGNF